MVILREEIDKKYQSSGWRHWQILAKTSFGKGDLLYKLTYDFNFGLALKRNQSFRGFRIIQNLYIEKDKLRFILNLKQKIYQKIIFFRTII